jgi:hypothetical protein
MEAASFPGVLVNFYRITLRYIPVDTALIYEKRSWDKRIVCQFSSRPDTENCIIIFPEFNALKKAVL